MKWNCCDVPSGRSGTVTRLSSVMRARSRGSARPQKRVGLMIRMLGPTIGLGLAVRSGGPTDVRIQKRPSRLAARPARTPGSFGVGRASQQEMDSETPASEAAYDPAWRPRTIPKHMTGDVQGRRVAPDRPIGLVLPKPPDQAKSYWDTARVSVRYLSSRDHAQLLTVVEQRRVSWYDLPPRA